MIYEKSIFCWEKEMRAFDYFAMKDQKWDSETVAYIAAIHEAKGKQELYLNHAPHYILQLHKILYGHSAKSIGGKFKNIQNYINATDESGKAYTLFTPLAPYETPLAMEEICGLCPSLSASSVEASLRKLAANGELVKQGAGRSTVYFWVK